MADDTVHVRNFAYTVAGTSPYDYGLQSNALDNDVHNGVTFRKSAGDVVSVWSSHLLAECSSTDIHGRVHYRFYCSISFLIRTAQCSGMSQDLGHKPLLRRVRMLEATFPFRSRNIRRQGRLADS